MVQGQGQSIWMRFTVLGLKMLLLVVHFNTLEMSVPTADHILKMLRLFAHQVYIEQTVLSFSYFSCVTTMANYIPVLHIVYLLLIVCAESSFECRYGHIDDQESPCVSAEQCCDGVNDCIGGEDELDHNCPCRPEGAVRLVDGAVPYRGRVEFCKSGWWSTICSYRYYYYWDNSDAAVVCHQLGYPREGMIQIIVHNHILCVY